MIHAEEASAEFWRRVGEMQDPTPYVRGIEPDPEATARACVDAVIRGITPADGVSVAEIGCGDGRIALPIARALWDAAARGVEVIGVDVSRGLLLRAATADRHGHVRWLEGDWRWLPLDDVSVDRLYSVAVLQHCPHEDLAPCMRETARVLKPGGWAWLQFSLAGGDGPLSVRHTVESMTEACERAGLEELRVLIGLAHPDWAWIRAVKPGAQP